MRERVSQNPVGVAVALGQTFGLLLAIGRPGLAFDFQLHQPLGARPVISRNRISLTGLLREGAQVHHGSRCLSVSQSIPPAGDHRKAARPLRFSLGRAYGLLYRVTGRRPK
ncbi:hypothetical protein GCM10007857_55890 [Bradyrhizobium iriomotense]|uniref:Uncharacterized protein n=1 Tax=Bradyrhizobium iriomotense TaxID=441950 RepID=A0ABQ6B5X0_9BRAD|nr:hypothetical protein GCM10007857_55890 [Bradyrhizobium iriomotense]